MTKTATASQVRAHYKALGCDVRISRDGHVMFRADGGVWLEGRYVSEYRLIDGAVVLI
jgi:hypothetical protein